MWKDIPATLKHITPVRIPTHSFPRNTDGTPTTKTDEQNRMYHYDDVIISHRSEKLGENAFPYYIVIDWKRSILCNPIEKKKVTLSRKGKKNVLHLSIPGKLSSSYRGPNPNLGDTIKGKFFWKSNQKKVYHQKAEKERARQEADIIANGFSTLFRSDSIRVHYF